jgi:hypothetical protein
MYVNVHHIHVISIEYNIILNETVLIIYLCTLGTIVTVIPYRVGAAIAYQQ